ncbi:AAA family ATPase [Paraferrimonas sp. SM1919]|uniref:AAA family ATPase n=1 Tax=Paraferrimonas sp. SM1919 TaxID=2662263 RepID=UPI0013D0D02E|nr:AAA family ATPase [Paraferrimonas sp. SM1919]
MKQLALELNTDNSEHTSSIGQCINELIEADIPQPVTIAPHFLTQGESTMLCSAAGASKTFTSQYLAACLSTGSHCFGFPTVKELKVLYIDAELSPYQIQERFKLIFSSLGCQPDDNNLTIIHKKSFKKGIPDLTYQEGYSQLADAFDSADVIILDNISSIYRSAEELNQNDWNFYNSCLDKLRAENKAILVLHHTDKSEKSYRGHSEIARAIDNVLIAKKNKLESTNQKTVVSIENTKCRHSATSGPMFEYEFGYIEGKFRFTKTR